MKNRQENSVNIITLGCSKNLVDSEQMANQLKANDFEVQFELSVKTNEIVIINTCGFIESAKAQSIENILQQVELKKKGKVKKVFVTGCLSERYKKDLEKDIPEVDAFFGTLELQNLLATLNADYKANLLGERILSTPKHYAYLKISEGCNRTCSFCAIPLMRGKHISKSIEQVLLEAQHLVNNGVKEILLIAQELTYYGLDIYKKRMLADLLEQLSDIKGLHWIRLHYAYPSKFPLEILEVMKRKNNICKYLDIPLQHASDNMLIQMKRQISLNEMNTLLTNIKNSVPDIAIRTSFIVGYPNETEEDFKILCDFIKTQAFDRVGVFKYSHEENTSAFENTNNISEKIKIKRYNKLMEIQYDIAVKKNQNKIGQIINVLIDKKEAGKFIGRSQHDSPEVDNEVIINDNPKIKIGNFYQVKITKAFDYDLQAEMIAEI